MAASSGALAAGAASNGLAIGLAPPMAMGMTYLATADSLGLAMSNATANQQRGQALANAALTQALAMILATGVPQS